MKLTIAHQEEYSRGELLLRSFFGFFYIMLPHGFLLMFFGIWGSSISFLSFWLILFTGRYPESFFEFQVKLMRWQIRVNARISNLVDGNPTFWLDGSDDLTSLEVPYPENLDRGHLLLKAFFGWLYCGIPHIFVLYFRLIATVFLQFLAWWAVLFTGKYPKSWHDFNVGTTRWSTRLGIYLGNMSDEYPPFSGRE